MVIRKIPYVGCEKYQRWRQDVGLDPKPPTKAAVAREAAEERRQQRSAARGMPVGVHRQKKSGRYLARVGALNVPGSYATIDEAVAAREAMIRELEKVGYDARRTTRT